MFSLFRTRTTNPYISHLTKFVVNPWYGIKNTKKGDVTSLDKQQNNKQLLTTGISNTNDNLQDGMIGKN